MFFFCFSVFFTANSPPKMSARLEEGKAATTSDDDAAPRSNWAGSIVSDAAAARTKKPKAKPTASPTSDFGASLFGDDDDDEDDGEEKKEPIRRAPSVAFARPESRAPANKRKQASQDATSLLYDIDDDYGSKVIRGNDDDSVGGQPRPSWSQLNGLEKGYDGDNLSDLVNKVRDSNRKPTSGGPSGGRGVPFPNGHTPHPNTVENTEKIFGTSRVMKAKPIMCESINNPIFSQSEVVQTFKFNQKLHEQRAKTPAENMIVPLGNPNCVDVMPDELAYLTNEEKVSRGPRNPHFADRFAVTMMNGLAPSTNVRVIGMTKGKAQAGIGAAHNAQTFTVRVRGTGTVKHTGKARIPAGARVAFSPIPHTLTIPGRLLNDGTRTPDGKIPAVAETGVPADKFRANIFELNHGSVVAFTQEYAVSIDKVLYDAMVKPGAPQYAPGLLRGLLDTCNKTIIDKIVGYNYGDSMQPVELFAHYYALHRAIDAAELMWLPAMAPVDQWAEFMKDVRTEVTLVKRSEERFYHTQQAAKLYNVPALLEASDSKWKLATVTDAPAPGEEIKVYRTRLHIMRTWLLESQRIAHGTQHTWADDKTIGIAMTTAMPGQDIDICLGRGV
jgi:hypothetical protein